MPYPLPPFQSPNKPGNGTTSSSHSSSTAFHPRNPASTSHINNKPKPPEATQPGLCSIYHPSSTCQCLPASPLLLGAPLLAPAAGGAAPCCCGPYWSMNRVWNCLNLSTKPDMTSSRGRMLQDTRHRARHSTAQGTARHRAQHGSGCQVVWCLGCNSRLAGGVWWQQLQQSPSCCSVETAYGTCVVSLLVNSEQNHADDPLRSQIVRAAASKMAECPSSMQSCVRV